MGCLGHGDQTFTNWKGHISYKDIKEQNGKINSNPEISMSAGKAMQGYPKSKKEKSLPQTGIGRRFTNAHGDCQDVTK